MSQFGNSGDKIAQTVAVSRYMLQGGFLSNASGYFRWYGGRLKMTS
jgi:hypothetical protein